MRKPNKFFLSTALLAVGMMSGGVFNLAFAQTEGQQAAPGYEIDSEIPEEEEDSSGGSSGAEWEDDTNYYPSSTETSPGFDVSDESAADDYMQSMSGEVSTDYTESSTGSTDEQAATLTEAIHTYPTFSAAEIDQLFNVTDVASDENSLAVEPIEGEEEGHNMNYLDNAVSRYRPFLPPDPVYTYGKDTKGNGTCAGTEDFCAKSSELYKTYLEKIEGNESLTITDAEHENYGNLVQPESYNKSADKYMPNVDPNACHCPGNYEVKEPGYNGVEQEHCGRYGALGTYYWKNCQ